MTNPAPGRNEAQTTAQSENGQPSVMSQWVDELTGRRGTAGLRVPPEIEIETMVAFFPTLRREDIISALQRRSVFYSSLVCRYGPSYAPNYCSPNQQAAAEALLQQSTR